MGTSSFGIQLKLLSLSLKKKTHYFLSDEFDETVVGRRVNRKLSLHKYWLLETASVLPFSSSTLTKWQYPNKVYEITHIMATNIVI